MIRIVSFILVSFVLAFTSYYIGANEGYKLGYKVGGIDAIMYGLQLGKVECRYVRKK